MNVENDHSDAYTIWLVNDSEKNVSNFLYVVRFDSHWTKIMNIE